jgi:hypothetical protein
VFEAESQVKKVGEDCLQGCSLKSICIPRSVTLLGKSCFCEAQIDTLTFESQSRLERIDDSCFQNCKLTSICIPRGVELLGSSCFAGSAEKPNKVGQVTFEPESRLRQIGESCFQYCLITGICIPRSVGVLCKSCFHHAEVGRFRFQCESQLTTIEEECFANCVLRSISSPRSLRALGELCFCQAAIGRFFVSRGIAIAAH